MDGLDSELATLGVTFALVLVRTGAMVVTAPVMSGGTLPAQVRGLLAVALAAFATPLALSAGEAPPAVASPIELAALAASELVIGLALGLGLMIVLSGVQLTGQIIGQMSGMALAEGSDPTFGGGASVFGQVYYLTVLAVFVAAGGHDVLVGGLLDTLEHAPPGRVAFGEELLGGLIGLASVGFEVGLRASAPLLTSLLMATVVLGLISRTVPQINTMVVGFGLNAMLTLGVMTASVGAVALVFQGPLTSVVDSVVASVGPAEQP